MNEIWKPVVGYEGLYEVSSLGRVKSLSREVKNGTATRITKEKILSIFCRNGYSSVSMCKKGVKNRPNVHKLMQYAFELGEGYIDHIDRNKSNNNLSNLRVVTNRENSWNYGEKGRLVGAYKTKYNKLNPWRSRACMDGKDVQIGYFKTQIEAHRAYIEFLHKNGISTEKMYI